MSDHETLHRKAYKRLTPDEIAEIAARHSDGTPLSALAQEFHVSERQLHRILKQQPRDPTAQRSRHIQPFIQDFHSAWIYEELKTDPHSSLDHIASGLRTYFDLNVSCSTVWRHIRGGTLEAHGFAGYTRPEAGDGIRV
jgi:hypothetical protein